MIPQNNIDITKKGEIFLRHNCINNRIRSKDCQLIWKNNIIQTNKCIYCQNEYDNCIKEHIEYNISLNDLEENGVYFAKKKHIYICTHFQRQFF